MISETAKMPPPYAWSRLNHNHCRFRSSSMDHIYPSDTLPK
jgi:hypothetical protein